ncbi:hypothetical protein D7S86_20325 [Pararobbsia silviterrae]|uniref:Uncharacterized protein n=1 Tax=Pararobbsia silviterrae TaxID=1792498 RepID=A0A494XNE4_9BURK|nr:hypothetical protein D7S86_20325 [Pararobbsia silviterrae]
MRHRRSGEATFMPLRDPIVYEATRRTRATQRDVCAGSMRTGGSDAPWWRIDRDACVRLCAGRIDGHRA